MSIYSQHTLDEEHAAQSAPGSVPIPIHMLFGLSVLATKMLFALGTLVLFALALAGCGDSLTTPVITSLSPSSATAGSGAFTLVVNGTGFATGTTVQWNGSVRNTTVVNPTQVKADIPASDIASAGTIQITVSNNGNTSSPTPFPVNAPANPSPAIASLSPSTAVAGGSAFTLTVNGSNFVSGATVQWGGAARTTSFVSSSQLTASIGADDIATAGSRQVTVVNPSPGGGASNAVAFSVTTAQATLTSLSPSQTVAGGPDFTLTVNGSGFLTGAAVNWNGSARPTTVVSASQLTASITAADISAVGSAQVDVVQGSQRSANQLSFTITPLPPSITSIAPSTVVAGSAGFDLSVNGSGFTNAAQITWNGAPLATSFVSATQLKTTIPASNVASAGTITIGVVQNSLSASNQQTFTISAAKPTITTISPASVTINAAAFTMSVNGTGFTSNSIVEWAGSALTTNFQNATLLTAEIPASNLTAAETFQITVSNPASEGGASAPVAFTVTNPASGKLVQLLSTNYQTGGVSNWSNNNSPPTLTQDGRYVGYNSYASNIVPGDTDGDTSGFLRDSCVGSPAPAVCTPGNTMVSATDANGYGVYRYVMVSSTGRFVGFDSRTQSEVNVRDTCVGAPAGCTPTVTDVLELPSDLYPGSLSSYAAGTESRMSPDGRYMMYDRYYYTPTTTLGVFVRDNCFGASGSCTPALKRIAMGKGASPIPRPFLSDLSVGGRYVLFRAPLTDVDPTLTDDGGVLHIWLEDTCIGAPADCSDSYSLIDVRADGTPSEGNLANDAIADEEPSFSPDGRYVVFSTTDKNMIAGRTINNGSEVYMRDTCIGAPAGCSPSTILISEWPTMSTTYSRGYIGWRSVSDHGRYVAFLHQGHRSGNVYGLDVFVRDTCIGAPAGCTPSTSMATNDPDGINPATNSDYMFPSISADGHYVAFMSSIGGTNGGQVYLALTGY